MNCLLLKYCINFKIINKNVFLSSSQIARIFNHRYLWYTAIHVLNFLHRDSYQGKIVSKTSNVVWVCPGMLRSVKTCLNLSGNDFSWSRGPLIVCSCFFFLEVSIDENHFKCLVENLVVCFILSLY